MENKRKHLEFIQSVISRMANNSFLLKGWAVTLIAALFIFATKDASVEFIFIAFIPIVTFWILDGYFLSQERQYRDLYNSVSKKDEPEIDYSMNASIYKDDNKNGWIRSIFSVTLNWFYLSLVVVMVIILCLIKYYK